MKEQEETIEGAELELFLEKLTGEPFHFGIILKAYRTRMDIKQTELAKKLGISRQNLFKSNKELTGEPLHFGVLMLRGLKKIAKQSRKSF